MRLFGEKMKLGMWGAVAGVLLGALTLSGCPTRRAATDVDGEGEVAPDASTAKADAGSGSAGGMAMPANGGSSGGGMRPSDAGAPSADGGTNPPPPNQTCTISAQCPSGFCVDGVCCATACDGGCES